MAEAIFAMGCFWKPEVIFRQVRGVTDATVGYCGGQVDNPDYHQVCRGNTGHAESVRVEYDPTQVSYEDLLNVFWGNHNPATRSRQGVDIGSQYRSAVFCLDDAQLHSAQASRTELQNSQRVAGNIVTQIVSAGVFYPAEDYHQRYLEKHGRAG